MAGLAYSEHLAGGRRQEAGAKWLFFDTLNTLALGAEAGAMRLRPPSPPTFSQANVALCAATPTLHPHAQPHHGVVLCGIQQPSSARPQGVAPPSSLLSITFSFPCFIPVATHGGSPRQLYRAGKKLGCSVFVG